jgi:processive 1,2-diacylglycerol beta-glucosyltransferase
MKLLLISYDALGGAGQALLEEAKNRGAQTERLELKKLLSINRRELSLYSRFVQRAKDLMSALYKAYDPTDEGFIRALTDEVNAGSFDAVVGTDGHAIRVITALRQHGLKALCYAVVDDYDAAAIPSIGALDGCFVAYDEMRPYLMRRGVDAELLYPYGTPLDGGFKQKRGKRAARNYLFIPQDRKVYLLLAGGMRYEDARDICAGMLGCEEDFLLYVLLPRDSEIREKLGAKFAGEEHIRVITLTKKLNIYMQGADVVLTRPLAYESYEAAAAGAPLVHITSVRGSDRRIADFFSSHEMSLKAGGVHDAIEKARRLANEKAVAARMKKRQERFVHPDAADRIIDTIYQAVN